ncbi:MAG: nicotinamide-nucleotide amidase [Gammaproteobacteria bacterium]
MNHEDQELYELAEAVGKQLQARQWLLATAESCTGGWIATAITSIAGSSQWFERGFVTYSDLAKEQMLGVRTETLAAHGAVSQQVVREMAEGALRHSRAEISVAVTGIAGPTGGTIEKPVGLVWFGWTGRYLATQTDAQHFHGNRQEIRRQAVVFALTRILEFFS